MIVGSTNKFGSFLIAAFTAELEGSLPVLAADAALNAIERVLLQGLGERGIPSLPLAYKQKRRPKEEKSVLVELSPRARYLRKNYNL
ncbi:MAG: hypothetical protein EBW38_19630 [Rhodobacteraceae bacterium]|nr:hypothetical protein [Paracoccaceae bacterium]